MAHLMTITLNDQEYNVLKAKAANSGKQVEAMLHEIMVGQLYLSSTSETVERPLTGREFMEQQYREGKLLNVPNKTTTYARGAGQTETACKSVSRRKICI